MKKSPVSAIIDYLPDGILITDQRGRILQYNNKLADVLGLTEAELKSCRTISALLDLLNVNKKVLYKRAARSPSYDKSYIDNNGQKRILNVKMSVLPNKRKKYMYICRNITAEKKVDEQLREEKQALEKKMQDLKEVKYTVGHDMKTPITAIQGYLHESFSELGKLINDPGIGPELKEALVRIVKLLEHVNQNNLTITKYSQEIMALASMEVRPLDIEDIDFPEIIKFTLERLKYRITEKNAIIIPLFETFPKTIKADRHLLSRLLENLLNNAMNYSMGSPRVQVFAEKKRNGWLISIKDDGIGISPEEYEKIMQFLGRGAKIEKNFKGTGIGLFTCKRIAEKHKGYLEVRSEGENQGSVFSFLIPE